ncbi:MAG: YCF48-related protein [Ignavibacteria bacterium]
MLNFIKETFFFLILFFSISNISAMDSWTRLNSPVSVALRNCFFTDNLNGWAAGDDGIIIHTSNGGNTFEIQNSTIDFYINDIFFVNERLGFVIANEFLFSGTTILKTTNGGINWAGEIFPDTTKVFRTIFFLDSLNGYMGGFAGAIFKTTDGANTWAQTIVDSSEFSQFPISKFNFANNDLGFACGGYTDVAGVIWRTTNGGSSWKAGNYASEPFYGLFIKDSQNIIASGGDFEYGVQISNSSNSGFTWNYTSLGIFGQSYSLDFRTSNEAWMALGYAQNWAVTYNSGASWTSIPTTDSVELYSVDFTDSLHGWAVGNNGVILKYVPGKVNIFSKEDNFASSYALFQNYPNPFNPFTKIEFQIPVSGYVSLNIYDVSGKTIKSFLKQRLDIGSHSYDFNGEGLSSGLYFYVLKIESVSSGEIVFYDTKKMILMK